jgi:hypothetical protein
MNARLIGAGTQYFVYDMGNGRVRKRATFRAWKYMRIICAGSLAPARLHRDVMLCEERGRRSIEGIRRLLPIMDAAIIGDPTFRTTLDYEQNKVIPLRRLLAKGAAAENRRIFELYLDHVVETWANGFSDIDFCFATNNGIDKAGRVILLDLGALSFDVDEIAEHLEREAWRKRPFFRRFRNPDLLRHVEARMRERLTPGELSRRWKRNVTHP